MNKRPGAPNPQTLRNRRAPFALRAIAGAVAIACASTAAANPTGPSVAAGAATFQTSGSTLTITNSPNAIINWGSFSIGTGETTRFLQQSAASAVLNRVVGNDPSSLLGTLSSNGRVFLINPNGIVVGAGARIDTAGFIASTLNMTDANFLKGRLAFEGGGFGVVRNEGTIRASGDIMLVGSRVENAGLIRSENGSVLLAAGQKLTITSPDSQGVRFEVQAPTDTALNVGAIEARNAVGMFAGTLRHSGDIRAGIATADESGRVVLLAQTDAVVDQHATITASGANGGSVQVLGDRVGVFDQARIDASGERGGGTILVGGDYQGKNSDIRNATQTIVGRDTELRADANSNGNGGKVVVWADGSTRFSGAASARGGASGGDGGLIETSGKESLNVSGARVDLGAPKGNAGTWLLDPKDLFVEFSSGLTYISNLTEVDAFSDLLALDRAIDPALFNNVNGVVLLRANNDVVVNAAINRVTSNFNNALVIEAGHSIFVNNNITTGGTVSGPITLTANATGAAPTGGATPTIAMAPGTKITAPNNSPVKLEFGTNVAANGSVVVASIEGASIDVTARGNGSITRTATGTSLLDAKAGDVTLTARGIGLPGDGNRIDAVATGKVVATSTPGAGGGIFLERANGFQSDAYALSANGHPVELRSINGRITMVGPLDLTGSNVTLTSGEVGDNSMIFVENGLGPVVVTASNLTLNMPPASSAQMNGGTITFNTALTVNGGFSNLSNPTVTLNGPTTINGPFTLDNQLNTPQPNNFGRIEANAPLDLNGNFTLSTAPGGPGGLGGTGTITLNGSTNTWNSGNMDGTGKTVVATSKVLGVDGANTKVANRGFENNGEVVINDATTLKLNGSGTDTGTYKFKKNSVLEIAGGTRKLTTGAVLQGELVTDPTGTVKLSGGSLEIDVALPAQTRPWQITDGTLITKATKPLTLNGPVTLSGGTLTGAGLITTGGLTTVDGAVTLQDVAWANAGGVEMLGPNARLLFAGNGANPTTFTNNATFDVNSNHATPIDIVGAAANKTFVNNGTFTKSGDANPVQTIGVAFSNNGTANVNNTLKLSGGGFDTNSYTLIDGATLEFSGGTRDILAAAPFAIATGDGTSRLSGGQLNVNSPVTVATTTFEITGGTLSGSDTLIVSSPTFNWTGGVMTKTATTSGETIINSGTTLNISGTADKVLRGRTLTNNGGTVNWTAGNILGGDSAVFNNAGNFNIQADSAWQREGLQSSGSDQIVNTGTITRSVGSGIAALDRARISGAGTINVNSGTLRVSADAGGAADLSGPINVASNATFELAGGIYTLKNTLSGAGDFSVDGGNVTLDPTTSALTNSGAIKVSGGLLFVETGTLPKLALSGTGGIGRTTPGDVTITGAFDATGGSIAQFQAGNFVTSGSTTVTGTVDVFNNWTNLGQIDVNGNGRIVLDSASPMTFVNGGTVNLNTSRELPFGNSTIATVTNTGTLNVKKNATGFTDFLNDFSNLTGGTTNVEAGQTLTLFGNGVGPGAHRGTFNVLATAKLDFAGNNEIATGASFTGTGPVYLSAGQLDVTSGSLSRLNLSGGVLKRSTPGDITVSGPLNISGGTVQFSGDLVTQGTTTITSIFDPQVVSWKNTGTVELGGTPNTGRIQAQLGASLQLRNEGTINVTTTDTTPFGTAPDTHIVNVATINKNSAVDATSVQLLDNAGTVNINAGSLKLGGPGTHSGIFVVVPGSTLEFAGGTHQLQAGANFGGGGTYLLSGGALDAIVGTLAKLRLTGGTLTRTDSGPVSISGAFEATGGTVGGMSAFTTADATVGGTLTLSDTRWNNTGTLTLRDVGQIVLAGLGVTPTGLNNTGTISDVSQSATPITIGSTTATNKRFTNAGVFTKAVGSVSSQTIDAPLTNTASGTINVSNGTLTATRLAPNAGTIEVAALSTFGTGGAELVNDGTLQGSGTFNVAGSRIVNNKTIAPGTSPGSLTIAGDLFQGPDGTIVVELANSWDPLESTCRHASLSIL